MPTPEVTPIPGLCISQTNLTTFINNLNLSFDLMVQTINEELGVSLTLPGIPPIPLAGMPSITIPKFEAMDINRRFAKQPGLRGYVGNVFPVSQGGKGLGGKYTLPGYPGFFVEGFQGQIPGIDPSTYIINLLNQNYQILVSQLAEEGVTVEVTEIPQLDLCGPDNTQGGQQPGGSSSSPGAVAVVGIVNQNNQNIINELPTGCIPDLSGFTTFTDTACWRELSSGSITLIRGVDSFSWSFTAGGVSNVVRNHRSPLQPPEAAAGPDCTPLPCANAWQIDYDFSGNAVASPDDIVGRFIVFSLDPDTSARTTIETKTHTITIGTSDSGSDSVIVAAGIVPLNHFIGVQVDVNVSGGVGSGSFDFTNVILVDNGP